MKRSKFSLSHTRLLSCDMGELVPIGMTEVLPGDSIQHATALLLRASPLLTPVMHPVDVRVHHFFVPWRLVWDDWENFITGGPDGMDASIHPTVSTTPAWAVGTIFDYMGAPTGVANITVSALPFRAYNLIWNEYFRDQDLQTPAVVDTSDGPETSTNFTLRNCAWEKDYFTSARPWEQKGPSITIPLGTQAPVTGIGIVSGTNTAAATGLQTSGTALSGFQAPANSPGIQVKTQTSGTVGAGNLPQIFADLTGVSSITVNALREALALQRYSEARANFGSRYTEYLRYLGVRSSDARLSRPEYLAGGRNLIQFSEVLQTGVTTSGSGLGVGDLRGHGITTVRSNRYRRFFEEHGCVMTLMSVRPKTMYFQGIPRHFNRRTKEDYWQSELQFIGQQEVLNKEIYAAHATPDGVFGYQDRYDEYRRNESSVNGEFRTTLNMWHMARDFGSTPALNATFVQANPTERIFAVPSTDNLWIMAKHSMQARRLVSASARPRTF